MPCYFFSGDRYIKVLRGDEAPGAVELGYPKSIAAWNWDGFGKNGIDAALNSDTVDYFFAGKEFIRVTRGGHDHGKVDAGYPKPISAWGWGEFGKNGISAALNDGEKYYFFAGLEYIRVTRGDTGAGTIDAGYPKSISEWGWGPFGLLGGVRGAMKSGDVDYFFSGSEYLRMRRDDTGKRKVDPGYPKPIWHWGWGQFGANGIDAALDSGMDHVPGGAVAEPSTGLGSNSNYRLFANCVSLVGLTVTINVTEEVKLKSSSGDLKGFSFQLNCASSIGLKCVFQQYVIAVIDESLVCAVNNWPNSTKTPLFIDEEELLDLPDNTIPVGTQLKIELKVAEEQKVVAAVFTVINHEGIRRAQKEIIILDIDGATKNDLAPIVQFQMNMVGPANSEKSVLSSGAGHFIYETESDLTVLNTNASCAGSTFITAETANTEYGKLDTGPFAAFSQTFKVGDEAKMIRVAENVHPGTVLKRLRKG